MICDQDDDSEDGEDSDDSDDSEDKAVAKEMMKVQNLPKIFIN